MRWVFEKRIFIIWEIMTWFQFSSLKNCLNIFEWIFLLIFVHFLLSFFSVLLCVWRFSTKKESYFVFLSCLSFISSTMKEDLLTIKLDVNFENEFRLFYRAFWLPCILNNTHEHNADQPQKWCQLPDLVRTISKMCH